MEIIYKAIADLRPYEKNPRVNDEAVEATKQSILLHGFLNPIIIDKAGVIIAGHTRHKAAQELGLPEVPCIVMDEDDPDLVRQYRIADNRTREFSGWDGNLLQAEMREINADDWQQFGFKEGEIRKFKPDNMCKCPKCGQTFVKV